MTKTPKTEADIVGKKPTQWVTLQRAHPGKTKPPTLAVRSARITRPTTNPPPNNNSGKNKNRRKPPVLSDDLPVDEADITISRLFGLFNHAVDKHGWEFALRQAKHHVGAALMWIALTDGYRAAYELAQQSADRIAPTAAQEAEQTLG